MLTANGSRDMGGAVLRSLSNSRDDYDDVDTVFVPPPADEKKGQGHVDAASTWSAISLVAGTTVGAGILALPAVATEAGFFPSAVALMGAWVFMATTGLLISEVCCNLVKRDKGLENIGVLNMVKITIGPYGAAGAGIVYCFISYALLVAYIAEAGEIISQSTHLPSWGGPVAFTVVVGGTLAFGSELAILSMNNFFVVIVIVSFGGLVAVGFPAVKVANLLHQNYGAVMQTVPTMFVALVYHNVVPVVCAQLHYNVQAIRIAISVGSLIPLAMFITWNLVILGIAVPGDLAVDPVELLRAGGAGELTGILISSFSEAAIVTSFIGFAIGLMDFFTDMFPDRSKKDTLLFGAVLIPPLIIAILDPDIFHYALDYAGTFGISVLFGAIPAIMALQMRCVTIALVFSLGDVFIFPSPTYSRVPPPPHYVDQGGRCAARRRTERNYQRAALVRAKSASASCRYPRRACLRPPCPRGTRGAVLGPAGYCYCDRTAHHGNF